MSMFFRYKGSLSFETEAEARKYYELLTTENDSWFCFVPEELKIEAAKIKFQASGNFAAYSICERTKDLINEAARHAKSGNVKVDEGDSEDSLWNLELISVAYLKKQKEKLLKQRAKFGFMEYALIGELQFADQETAAKLFEKLSVNSEEKMALIDRIKSQGREVNLHLNQKTVVFNDKLLVKSQVIEELRTVLDEFAAQAVKGKVEIEEADVYGVAQGSQIIYSKKGE